MTAERRLRLTPGQHIHLMGVGGVGMSGLAGILAGRGFTVTGSDSGEGVRVAALRELGVSIHVPQVAGGAGDADAVVVSTAIPERNPELVDARERGLPLFHRSELLAAIIDGMSKVAVSGTHGKTTTTSMLATILLEAGRDPLVLVGGDAANLGTNYHAGSEDLAVFEACESDATFLRYGPCSEIITNVEADHLDQHGTFEAVCDAFGRFIDLVPEDGFLAWGADCAVLGEMVERCAGRTIACGMSENAIFRAECVEPGPFGVSFRLRAGGEEVGEVQLRVPGEHNVLNALCAAAAASEAGVAPEEALAGLGAFRGVGRRFELICELDGALVVDDYAHHPTEVAATLAAARRGWPERRVVAVFQPHLYSRTRDFMQQFAEALATADAVVVAGIYGAREEPIEGVDAAELARRVGEIAPGVPVRYVAERAEVTGVVRRMARPDDLILTIGAGDIRRVAEELA
ncbi:MAG: UDP-N-acetylmuramate--L-alanine ligase [Armatimonadota bacterium]|jgi:UDP-N-acetylmuramate--alanine ligase